MDLLDKNNIKSFNEDVTINFEPKNHIYNYEGRILTGATTVLKKYIKEFNSEEISKKCEMYWQVPQQKILNAWELSGDVARDFGSAIHAAIEYEDLYRFHRKKNGDRCFTIKHPIIKKIVEDFYAFARTFGFKGKSFPEALVSDVENGICALVDKLIVTDFNKKEVELIDYKVNIDYLKHGEVTFKNLPNGVNLEPTKLSKLALQLHIQKEMLQKSGWKVVGLHAFVLEDEWKYYKVPNLDGFDILKGTFEA